MDAPDHAPNAERSKPFGPDEPTKPGRREWPLKIALVLGLVSLGLPLGCTSEGGANAKRESAGPGAAAVVSAPIERGSMVVRRRYPGELFSDAVELGSRIAGQIEAVHVRIGDRVEADQVVAELDDELLRRQLRELRAQLRARRALVRSGEVAEKAAEREFERVRALLERGASSQQELDALETDLGLREAASASAAAQAEQAQASIAVLEETLADTGIRAPFAGVVARRDVDPGAYVQPGQAIVRLVAEQPLRVRFRVPEHELADVHEGLGFALETRMLLAETPRGTITRMAGEVSAADRSLLIEGEVEPHAALRPGMYADVRLDLRALEGVLLIPDAALLERVDAGGRASTGVFRVERDEQDGAVARWVDVRVLGREGTRVAVEPVVADALSEAHEVLIRGHRELGEGAAIRVRTEHPG